MHYVEKMVNFNMKCDGFTNIRIFDIGVIQKICAAIFEILRDFSGDQSLNICHFDSILDFDPPKNHEKSKFFYHPRTKYVCVKNL